CRLAGRAVGARFEIDIPEAPFTSPREQCDLLVHGEVGDHFSGLRVRDHRAGRHAQYDVICALPVALGTAPSLAVPRAVNAREAILDEGIDVSIGDRIDAAAAAAVPAVRPSARYVLFAPEAHDAVAAIAGVDLDARFVDEFHGACGNKKPYRVDRAFGKSSLLLSRDHADRLFVVRAPEAELDLAVHLCEKGMVLPDPDVVPGVNASTALANDDAARGYDLAAVAFDAETL